MQVVLEVSELVIDLKNTKDRENKTLYKTGGTKNEKQWKTLMEREGQTETEHRQH